MKKNDLPPFINVTEKAKNFSMVDCEVVDHGSNRPFLTTQAEGTKLVRTTFSFPRGVARQVREHPWRTFFIGLAVAIIGGFAVVLFEHALFPTPPIG